MQISQIEAACKQLVHFTTIQ